MLRILIDNVDNKQQETDNVSRETDLRQNQKRRTTGQKCSNKMKNAFNRLISRLDTAEEIHIFDSEIISKDKSKILSSVKVSFQNTLSHQTNI
jgi:ribosomal protein S20